MRKIIFVLLAFFAIFTYIRSLDVEAEEIPKKAEVELQSAIES